MQGIVEYIKNPSHMGKQAEDRLTQLLDKYPYFNTLHVLLAKSQKNQHAFAYTKSLKSASLYAGDRKILYKFIEGRIEQANTEERIEHKNEASLSESTFIKEEEIISIDQTQNNKEETSVLPVIDSIKMDIEETTLEAEAENLVETSEIVIPIIEVNEVIPDKVVEIPVEIITPITPLEPNVEAIQTNHEIEAETPLTNKESDLSNEQDFYSWLDNFNIETPQALQENFNTEPTPVVNEYKEEESELDTDILEAIETGDDTIVYDPAGWAEIAYDIQAFVKHKEPEPEEEKTPKGQTKEEIDALLDRFIKKNPSISRTRTEFYKPENMARKSEEFHGEVASETLASLFYRQGHLHKSLELYEKLILQNPDKKEIFAARIKSIKEELINRL